MLPPSQPTPTPKSATPKSATPTPKSAKKPNTRSQTEDSTPAPKNTTPAPKEPTNADILKKLDEYLAENVKLREINENLSKTLENFREINENLSKRVETLENLLAEKNAKTTTTEETQLPPPPPPPSPKIQYDVLILSDSIYRHVGGDTPTKIKPPRTTSFDPPDWPKWKQALEQDVPICGSEIRLKKVVVPGARASRLWYEASRLALTCNFNQILVHVGTNYLSSKRDPEEAVDQIQNLLTSLRTLFNCKIVFSLVLPRVARDDALTGPYDLSDDSYDLVESVRFLNDELIDFCRSKNFGTFFCPAFRMNIDDPAPKKHFLSKDGCHLSRRGVVELEHSVFDHLNYYSGTKRLS